MADEKTPQAPDLTIERAEVAIRYRLGTPTLGRITLVRPRLFGTLRGGKLSFGTLDKALFRDFIARLRQQEVLRTNEAGLLEFDDDINRIGDDARLVLGEEIRHSILSLTFSDVQAEPAA